MSILHICSPFQNFGLIGNEAYEHELRSSLTLYSRDCVILKFQMHEITLL